MTQPNPLVGLGQAVAVEAIITGLLVIVVFAVAVLSACKGWGITLASCAVEEAMVGKGFGGIESLNESSTMAAAYGGEFAALQQCPPWAEGLDYSICDEFGAKVESEG